MMTLLCMFGIIIYIVIYLILVALGVVKPQPQKTTTRKATRRPAPKKTYATTRVTAPKTHGITTTTTTTASRGRCSNCGAYVHVKANGAYECGYCANYYGGNR